MKARNVNGYMVDLDSGECMNATMLRQDDGTWAFNPAMVDFLERAYAAEEERGEWPGQVWQRDSWGGEIGKADTIPMLVAIGATIVGVQSYRDGRLVFDPRIGIERPPKEA